MYVVRCAFLVLCFLVKARSAKTMNNRLYRLDIVHYNDFHDRFEETSVLYPVCQTNDTNCLGGFPRLYQGIQILLKEKPEALVLNAGDTFQGTYWYGFLKWNITQTFINMLPNDVHAIGNHEFDDGVAGLALYLAALRAPVVAANMNTSLEPELNGLYKPHVILERNGRKIGIIGLIATETQRLSNSEKVQFLDPITTVQNEAQILKDKNVDIIIVLSHCGFEKDKKIAAQVGENIDVIVGGHSHTLLWNGISPINETIRGPYPVVVDTESKPGHKVLIVTAAAFTKYLGNFTVYFDEDGEMQSFDGEPMLLNRSIPEDPKIKALLEPYAQKLHLLVNEVVGNSTVDLLTRPCWIGECLYGDFVANAMLNNITDKKLSNLTHVSFLLRAMLRGSIPKGDITKGALMNATPFSNNIVTMVLRGEYILKALEKCLQWETHTGFWLPHFAGMRATLNTTSRKTISVEVKEGASFQPLDLQKEYQFITFSFLTKPAESAFRMLKKGRNFTTFGKDRDVLEHYIRKMSPINLALDERLTIVK